MPGRFATLATRLASTLDSRMHRGGLWRCYNKQWRSRRLPSGARFPTARNSPFSEQSLPPPSLLYPTPHLALPAAPLLCAAYWSTRSERGLGASFCGQVARGGRVQEARRPRVARGGRVLASSGNTATGARGGGRV